MGREEGGNYLARLEADRAVFLAACPLIKYRESVITGY
jgi:hypothetical protein